MRSDENGLGKNKAKSSTHLCLRFRNKEFDAFLQTLKHKSVLLLGDLNVAPHPVDLHNPKGNLMSAGFSKEEREDFHALLKSADLVDSYRHLHPVADLNVSLGIFQKFVFLFHDMWLIAVLFKEPKETVTHIGAFVTTREKQTKDGELIMCWCRKL